MGRDRPLSRNRYENETSGDGRQGGNNDEARLRPEQFTAICKDARLPGLE